MQCSSANAGSGCGLFVVFESVFEFRVKPNAVFKSFMRNNRVGTTGLQRFCGDYLCQSVCSAIR